MPILDGNSELKMDVKGLVSNAAVALPSTPEMRRQIRSPYGKPRATYGTKYNKFRRNEPQIGCILLV